jgi:Tol biopolymer transport system component
MPFISPDESYMIYVLKKDKSKTDLHIRIKIGDNSWSEAIDMGPTVNSATHDLAPYVSPDSKYLFFISQRERMNGIMWMSTEIINVLNQKWLIQLKK